jgi:hypothetical protein
LIEKFEQHWPLGTKQRLIFDIYLYTGLRRGDCARLGKQHIKRGIIHLLTEKSQGRMPVFIPVHPALEVSIKACPSKGLAIVSTDDGRNFAKESVGNLFREAVEAASLPVSVSRKGRLTSRRKRYRVDDLEGCALGFPCSITVDPTRLTNFVEELSPDLVDFPSLRHGGNRVFRDAFQSQIEGVGKAAAARQVWGRLYRWHRLGRMQRVDEHEVRLVLGGRPHGQIFQISQVAHSPGLL